MKTWEEVQAQVDLKFSCECQDTEIRFRVYSNSVKHFFRQCVRCGAYGASLKKTEVPFRTQQLCVAVDEKLRDDWQEKRREYSMQLKRAGLREETQEWFEQYSAYLNSEAWKKKARKVLERDGHLCQACLVRPATQVHHKTYEHVFNEPLFDLVSVCLVCHDFITKLDRTRRGTADLVPR